MQRFAGIIASSDHLKSSGVRDGVRMALLAVYDNEPHAPVEYLANWLLNYSQIQKQLAIVTAALEEANQTNEKDDEDGQMMARGQENNARTDVKQVRNFFVDVFDEAAEISQKSQEVTEFDTQFSQSEASEVNH